jgi:hypothetical protein
MPFNTFPMKIQAIFLFLLFAFTGALSAQQQLTYTVKLTRVFSGLAVDSDAHGPDLTYRMRARIQGGGMNVPGSINLFLPDEQRTGWIDIPDLVIATGTTPAGGPPIDLVSTGIGIVFDRIEFWESDNESDPFSYDPDVPSAIPDEYAQFFSPGRLGGPQRAPTSGEEFKFELNFSNHPSNPSPWGFEISVSYVLENALREVTIAGNAQGGPIADVCEGGQVYLSGQVGPRFTGGYLRYELSEDGGNNWSTVGFGRPGSPAASVPLRVGPNVRYRASLYQLQFGGALNGDAVEANRYRSPIDLANLGVFPSIASADIRMSTTNTCAGGTNGSLTVDEIVNVPPGTRLRLQLSKLNAPAGFVQAPTVEVTSFPFTFSNLNGGLYSVAASYISVNAQGQTTANCTTFSSGIFLQESQPPIVGSVQPQSPVCAPTEGQVTVLGWLASTATLFRADGTLLAGPISPIASGFYVFTDLGGGAYFVRLTASSGCTTDSAPFLLDPFTGPASGTFAAVDGSLNIDCPNGLVELNFTPDAGTGDNTVRLTRTFDGLTRTRFSEIVMAGTPYTALLPAGDYTLTFVRLDNGCSQTQTFSIAPNQPSVAVSLLSVTGPTDCAPETGTLELSLTGGQPPFAVTILGLDNTPTVTPDGAGGFTYSYTGLPDGVLIFSITEANGCTSFQEYRVPTPAGVSLSFFSPTSLRVSCNGEQDAQVFLNGTGVLPLSYRIIGLGDGTFGPTTFFENLGPGTYTAEMMDASVPPCPASVVFTIAEPTPFTLIEASVVERIVCVQNPSGAGANIPELRYDIRTLVAVPLLLEGFCSGADEFGLSEMLRFSLDGLGTTAFVSDANNVRENIESCDSIMEITFLDRAPGDYDISFLFAQGAANPDDIICASNTISLTAADFTGSTLPFVEIIGTTDPSCFGASDGTLTVRFGGGEPGSSYNLFLFGGTFDTNATIRTSFPRPGITNFFNNIPYAPERTITFTGLPDLANLTFPIADAYYFLSLSYDRPGDTGCVIYSIPTAPPLADQVRLNAPAPLIYTSTVTQQLECDGTGGTIVIDLADGGTPPYTYSLRGGEFTTDNIFNFTGPGPLPIVMRDAQGCTFQTATTPTATFAPTVDFGITFTPPPVLGCPPPPDEALTGTMQLAGELGEHTYAFSGPGVVQPFAVTTSDSVIALSGLAVGIVNVSITNTATGESCQSASFVVPPPVPQLTATTTTNVGESCPGAADGTVGIQIAGGVPPYTTIALGNLQIIEPIGPDMIIDELIIENLPYGILFVGIRDANDCELIHEVRVEPSAATGLVTITNTAATPCGDNDNASITVTGANGSGPYQLVWLGDDGFTQPLGAGQSTTRSGLSRQEYDLEVTDANGCMEIYHLMPTGRDPIIPEVVDVVQPACGGGGSFRINILKNSRPASATPRVSLNGAAAVDQLNFTGMAPGVYDIQVLDDAGCGQASPLTVTLLDGNGPTVSFTSENAGCSGQTEGEISVVASNGTPPYQYSLNGAPAVSSGAFTTLGAGTYTIVVTDAAGCTATTGPVVLTAFGAVVGQVIAQTNSCAGESTGTITLFGTSGRAPFEYRLENGIYGSEMAIRNLAAGNYRLQIRDANGCESELIDGAVSTFNLVLNVVSAEDESCESGNGSISVQAVGDRPPFRYTWSDDPTRRLASATNLAAGTYTISVSNAAGCSDETTVVLGTTQAITASLENSAPSRCGDDNGTAAVSTMGGIDPVTYAWSHDPAADAPTVDNLPGGTHSVTVTSANGCTDQVTFSISSVPGISQVDAAVTPTSCGLDNGIITATPLDGNASFTYAWSHSATLTSNTATGLAAGDYTVTVTDADACFAEETFRVGGSSPVVITLASQVEPSGGLSNGSISLSTSGFTAPLTYTWSHDPNLNGPLAENLAAGIYTVLVEDVNLCVAEITINLNTGLEAELINLADAICTDDNGAAEVNILSGTPPYSYAWSHAPGENVSSFNDLAAGDYTVMVGDDAGAMIVLNFTLGFIAGPTAVVATSNTGTRCGESNAVLIVAPAGGTAPFTYAWADFPAIDGPGLSDLAPGNYAVTITDGNGCTVAETFTVDGSSLPLVSLEVRTDPDPGLNNGSISITTAGMALPLTYVWSHDAGLNAPLAEGLANGSYTVTVTGANGCTDALTIVLNGPDPIVAEVIDLMDAICTDDNGTATVRVISGVAPFSYDWAHAPGQVVAGFVNLSAGDYTVTVTDAAGVTLELTFTIGFIVGPTAIDAVLQLATICGFDNGILQLAPVGGTAPYVYAWSHDVNLLDGEARGLAPGDYSVTITDANGCSVSDTYRIDGSATPTAELLEQGDASCGQANGFLRVITANLSEPLAYDWSHDGSLDAPLAENLSSGNYSVTITGSLGCRVQVEASVSSLDGPAISLLSIERSTCIAADGSITISYDGGGQGPFTYTWSHNAGLNEPQANNLAAGNYGVTITDATGCSDALLARVTAAVTALLPNLSTAAASCAQNDGSASVTLGDGTAPFTYEWSHDASLSGPGTANLPEGDHSLTITDGNGCSETVSFSIFTTDGPTGITAMLELATICGFDNGILQLAPVGGTAPYTYAWSHDGNLLVSEARSLAPGDYSVTITDANSCTISETYNIGESETPTAEILEQGDASCGQANGFLRVTTTNFSGPLTYEWSHDASLNGPDATNLPEGDHSLTIIDAVGCSETVRFTTLTTEGPTEITAVLELATICGFDNGILQLAPVGGTVPYVYAWSHDVNLLDGEARGLAPGDYSVTITDANGCTISETYNIGESETPTAEILEQGDASCGQANGFLRVTTANLGEPLTYEWSHDENLNAPLAENLGSGDYRVTIIGGLGCSAEIAVSVSNLDGPSISLLSVEPSTCTAADGSIAVSYDGGGQGPFTYTWSHDAGLNEPQANNLVAGNYGLTITDATGCSDVLMATVTTAFTALLPNLSTAPASCAQNDGSANVTLSGGTAPFTYNWSHDASLSGPGATNLPVGAHSLTITDGNGCSETVSFAIFTSDGPTAVTTIQQLATVCGLGNGLLRVAPEGGTAPYTYAWSHDGELRSDEARNLAAGDYTVTITDANGCTISASLSVGESAVPAASIAAQTAPTCSQLNGSLTVAVTGLTAPLTYEWAHDVDLNAPIAGGLGAGTYGVTITDVNGCSASLSVDLIDVDGPTNLTAVSLTPTSCGATNGALTVAVTGGTAPFTYAWSHDATISGAGATDLDGGIYRVVATDLNGCTTSSTFSIPNSARLVVVTEEVVGANCNLENGSILISVANATGEVTYDWSHDADLNTPLLTGLAAGNYMVTVTDENGCSAEAIIMVNSLDNPASFTIAASPSNCEDGQGSIAVTITDGRPPYTYAWSHDALLNAPVATGLAAGDYSVEVTDATGCQVLLEAAVLFIDGPVATIESSAPTCSGAANGILLAIPSGGSEPFSYLWSTSAVTPSINDAVAGTYAVTVTDANGCTSSVEVLLGDGPAVVISLLDSVPASCADLADGRLEVAAAGGNAPYTFRWSEGTDGPLAEGLSAGVTYLVTVTSAEGCTVEMSYALPDVEALRLPLPADTTLCQDDIWVLDLTAYTNPLVTGPNGFSSNDVVVLIDEAGTYTVTATEASGCVAVTDINVNFTGQSFVAGMVLPSDVVVGDSIVVLETSWPAPDNVFWAFDRVGARQIAQEQNQYWFVFDEAGEYQLSLLASFGGCDDLITKGLTVHPDSTSIPTVQLTRSGIEAIVISPNPNNGRFNAEVILSNDDLIFLNLYKLDGTPIDRREDGGRSDYIFNYDLNLEAGAYLLLVQTRTARRTVVIVVSE